MKIQTDQLTALRQTTDTASETQKNSDAFATLLAKEVGTQSASQSTGLAAPLLSGYSALNIQGLQETGSTEAVTETTQEERTAMDSMDTLLDQWEEYSNQLASGTEGDSLKKAYGVLENIASGVQQLKESLPSGTTGSGLDSMVNELEVMTVTEQFKFNRGDYAA